MQALHLIDEAVRSSFFKQNSVDGSLMEDTSAVAWCDVFLLMCQVFSCAWRGVMFFSCDVTSSWATLHELTPSLLLLASKVSYRSFTKIRYRFPVMSFTHEGTPNTFSLLVLHLLKWSVQSKTNVLPPCFRHHSCPTLNLLSCEYSIEIPFPQEKQHEKI